MNEVYIISCNKWIINGENRWVVEGNSNQTLQRPSAIVQHIISSVFDNLRSLNLDATLLARWFLACSFYWTQNNQYCLAVFYRALEKCQILNSIEQIGADEYK